MNRKPTYENGYQGLPFLTPFSPGREYKDPMGKSNIFTGSVGTLNTMSTPVNATPISMLKSLNMVNEEPSFEQFRKSRYQKQRKKSKSKTGVKGFLKKVLAKQLGEEGEEETDSDNSDKSEDETIMNSTSSPVKQVIRLTEPLPHMQYPGPMKQQFNPYGYQNQMMPPNQNFMQPRLQPVYPQIQPIPSPLASNGRKIIQVPVRQNHFGPNNMMPSYGQNLFSPYGPMRPGFGPGMPNGQNGYMFQQPNQIDPMMKARMEAEEKRKREQDEQDELERKKKQEILDKKKQAQAAAKLAQRKAIAKKRLKTYSWFMLYPILLKRSVKNVVLFAKKKTMVEVPKKLNSSFEVIFLLCL